MAKANGNTKGPEVQVDARQSSPQEDGPVLQKKLSVKTIVGDLRALIMHPDNDKRLILPSSVCTMMGIANNIETGLSQYGIWQALVGDFECVNLLTGEVHIGSKLFIPEPAGSILVEQVRAFIISAVELTDEEKTKPKTQQIQKYTANGNSVEFALEIVAIPNPKTTGAPYEYQTRPLVQVQRSDKLLALRDIVRTKVKIPARLALSAPSAA
jgi:hypothetical protein